MKKRYIPLTACVVALTFGAPGVAQQARACLINPQADTVGMAKLTQTDSGVHIRARFDHLPPGIHALHIHEKGVCDPPEFAAAQGHYNPHKRQHGFLNPKGPHAGDLPNFVVWFDSTARVDLTTALVTLEEGKRNSLFSPDSTALVVHAKADNHLTDPAGAAGPRIACGVIRRYEQDSKKSDRNPGR